MFQKLEFFMDVVHERRVAWKALMRFFELHSFPEASRARFVGVHGITYALWKITALPSYRVTKIAIKCTGLHQALYNNLGARWAVAHFLNTKHVGVGAFNGHSPIEWMAQYGEVGLDDVLSYLNAQSFGR